MDISLIIKMAGIGIIVAVTASVLSKSGRDEQATFVTLAGIIVAMLVLVGELGKLFDTIMSVFGM